MRVLVTGSRTWDDPEPIRKWLRVLLANSEHLTVVHGGCDRGADAIAANWCVEQIARGCAVEVERHPADWRRYGRAAGPIRNAEMVKADIDLCLAFIRDDSPGASHCARLAEAAGIETRVYRWWEERGGAS